MPRINRSSALLTQDLCKLIKESDHVAPVTEFFNQFQKDDAAEQKLLKSALENSELTDYRATPLITSYIIASEKTKNFNVFNVVFDKVVEMWKDDTNSFGMLINKRTAEQYFFEGSGDGQSTPLLFHATLLNLICRNSDETSLKRVIDAAVKLHHPDKNNRVLDLLFFGFDMDLVENVFIYATPSFIEKFFALTVDTLADTAEVHKNCMKHIFEEDRSASSVFSSICQRATKVENVKIFFDKIRAIGGQDLLRHRFQSFTASRITTLMTAVVKSQKSFEIVKFIFETLKELELLQDQFRCERDDKGRDMSVLARMCEHQISLEIVKYIFEKIETNPNIFDKEYWKDNFRGDRYPLYIQCLGQCLRNSSSHDDTSRDVLKFLLDSATALNPARFQSTSWTPQGLPPFLFSCASRNSFVGVVMILAHFSNEKTCKELVQFRDDHGRTAAAMTSSQKLQQLLKSSTPWRSSIEAYRKMFDGALPPVAPWKNDDTFSWLKNIVDEINGLEMNSAEVINLIFGLGENEIASPERLGAAEQTKIDEILSDVNDTTLKASIKSLAESEHKKQHQPALPFITELFTKLAVTPLDDDSIGILVKNKIKSVEDFMDLSIDDLKEMSFPIGERKRIQEAQKKHNSNSSTSDNNDSSVMSPSSLLCRRIASQFPPNCIYAWSDIKIDPQNALLGSGGFGAVSVATLTNVNNRPVAAKTFNSQTTTDEKVIQECKIAMNLHHNNIIKFVGISVRPATPPFSAEAIYALFELGKRDLSKKLSSVNLLAWREVFQYAFQIASGLDYLHNTAKINHLDLKPANVLLDENNIVKLCDFGLVRVMEQDASHVDVSRAGFGSYRWMCPEQLVSTEMRPSNDVYSYGCILYNMIDKEGRAPWHHLESNNGGNNNHAIWATLISEDNKRDSLLASRISSEHRADCPPFLVQLCKACLNSDYKMRPKQGGELVEFLKRSILGFVESNEEWKVNIGDVSYLGVNFSSVGNDVAGGGVASSSDVSQTVSEHWNTLSQ